MVVYFFLTNITLLDILCSSSLTKLMAFMKFQQTYDVEPVLS